MTESSTTNDWYSSDHATFGDRLTAAREAQGLDQAALARKLGVKLRTIEAWENDNSEPRANKLQMVAGLLNVSLRWLMTGEGEGVSEPASQEELAADGVALLSEISALRQEMAQMTTRMGRTEKKLRQLLKEVV